jgi:hypothetical protein
MVDSEFLSAFLKNIPFFCTLLGFVLSLFLVNCFSVSPKAVYSLKTSSFVRACYTFLTQK